jgi:hypothetical protein
MNAGPDFFLCIVSTHRVDVLGRVARAFRMLRNVEIIMDRRVSSERRNLERATAEGSQPTDRRRSNVEARLEKDGFVVVPRRQ